MSLLKFQFITYGLFSLILFLAWVWGALALYFAGPAPAWLRFLLVLLFVLALPLAFYFTKSYWHGAAVAAVVFTCLLVWWSTLKPSNDRHWHTDVANTPYGDIKGDVLTLHNVRNFHYRTRVDYNPAWETRTYDLSKITSLDLFLSYWGSPHIAHTILSWGFDNGKHLAISIETRKDVTQSYSSVKGFFKQFTLVYVAADEKDLIRLRTNVRKEEVYLYPLRNVPQDRARALLESYLRHMNSLVTKPEFYHAMEMNCTSVITLHTKMIDPRAHIADWRLIANGHVDEMLYERGTIRNDLPFTQIRKASRVDQCMQQNDVAEFSAQLRACLQLQ